MPELAKSNGTESSVLSTLATIPVRILYRKFKNCLKLLEDPKFAKSATPDDTKNDVEMKRPYGRC